METNAYYFKDTSLQIKKQNYLKEKCNMPLHTHDYLTISLLLKGSLLEHTTGYNQFAQAGSLSIKPANVPHSDVFTGDCSILSMKIFDWDYYQFDFMEWEWIPHSMAIKYFLNVIHANDKRESLYELKSFLIAKSKQKSEKQAIPEWLSTVHRILMNHFQEQLQISCLAKEVGKHPVHLARTFRKFYGIDLKTYQKHLRIHYAMSEAMNQKKSLTQIAYASGFSDQSHFSREFKKMTNFSPRQAILPLNV